MRLGFRARSARPAALALNPSAPCLVDQTGLEHVKFRPVNTIVKKFLPAARQHLAAFLRRQTKLGSKPFFDFRHPGFALCGPFQNREHEGLVIGNSQRSDPLWKSIYLKAFLSKALVDGTSMKSTKV
jgi:hypothetical protein